MSLRYRWWLFVVLSLALPGLAGCPATPQATPPPQPQQQPLSRLPDDDIGRKIELKGVPGRIVVIGPGVTEIIFALGAGSQLVGRDEMSNYPRGKFPQGVDGLPVVADYRGPFFEKVAAVRPDLIIAQGETFDTGRAEIWQEKCGAPVAVVGAHTLEEVAKDIEKIGAWIGHSDATDKLVRPLRQAARAPAAGGPSLFIEIDRSTSLWTAGRGTLVDDVIRAAGCVNIAGNIEGYQQYSLEMLAAKNPDYYLVGKDNMDAGRALQELRRQPAFKNLEAVRAGRVIVVPGDFLLRPGPRLVQGIKLLKQAVLEKSEK